jgi:hypothetical protein
MSTSPVINALIGKRAELAGSAATLERQLARVRDDLGHIDATLRLFDPTIKPATIKPRAPAPTRSAHFEVGEIARRCRAGMRDAGPDGVTADGLALVAMRDKGVDPDDTAIRSDFARRLYWTFIRLAQKGEVAKTGQGMASTWTLA